MSTSSEKRRLGVLTISEKCSSGSAVDTSGPAVLSLSRYGSEADSVSWSADHRVAVTTPDIVFVCTLRSPSHTRNLPTHKPPMIMSTVHALPLSQKVGVAPPRTITEHIDPVFVQTSHKHNCFKRSDWSPAGCSKCGGCVLTALTSGGCLVSYAAPYTGWRVWKRALSLTDCLANTPQLSEMSVSTAALFTHCAAFAWLPHTLNSGHDGLVAMTTRSGHLVLIKIGLPITESSGTAVVWMDSLLGCEDEEVWGCALKWSKCDNMLAVGCTDGQILLISWEALDTPTSSQIKVLWPSDSIPVYHMTYLTRPHNLVCTKGSTLLVCPLDEGDPLTVCGHHTLPVSGVSALAEDTLLSASRDGTLQVWKWREKQPRPLKTGMYVRDQLSIQGLAVSHNGLLAAFSVNGRMNQAKKQCSYLYFLNLVTVEETMATIQQKTVQLPWDVNECLRQFHLQSLSLSDYPHFEHLVSTCHKSTELSALMALQASLIYNQPLPQQVKAKQNVLREHAQKCLDELNVGSTTLDAVSKHTLKLMLSWLLSVGVSSWHEKILSHCSSDVEPFQLCPACGLEATLRDELLSYSCAGGHSWDICPLSFQLVSVCCECSVCAQCGSGVNTISSLRPENGSWLHQLLTQQTQCLYCGGYYQSMC